MDNVGVPELELSGKLALLGKLTNEAIKDLRGQQRRKEGLSCCALTKQGLTTMLVSAVIHALIYHLPSVFVH